MLDPNRIRKQLEETAESLLRRGFQLDVMGLRELEANRKDLQVRTQGLQQQRNTHSKAIGRAKADGEDISALLAEVAKLGDELKMAQEELSGVQSRLDEELLGIPNVPQESVLFNMTIRDNLLWADENASAEDIRRACELANAAGFIEELEDE